MPDIDEEALRKLPYWNQWLYRALRELDKRKE